MISKKYFKQSNYANRGMILENDLNETNKYYLQNNIAVIYKKPTPIKVVNGFMRDIFLTTMMGSTEVNGC